MWQWLILGDMTVSPQSSMGGPFQAIAGFRDSEIFQKAIEVAL